MTGAEILAPAGGMEQLIAAVRCGADAVYLGTGGFNARRNAANFTAASLREAVAYCHGRGAKVYVTVNTLVMDTEWAALESAAAEIAAAGADAVIVQDLAVMEFFRENYPTLRLHASTQTAVHNVEGALELQELGCECVVLARELTLEEMAKISEAVNIRTEAFVHGAHCMSVSGACYLSGMLGGRSGNRGLCAQPCRLDWRCGEGNHVLSLKDMSLISHIREMAEAGVGSFKIEGRMKRAEYVAAAVTACKNALEGKAYDEERLRAVFSRSGFTDGYLTGRRDGAMFGIRTKEDVTGAEKVLGELRGLYRGETPRVAVDMSFAATPEGSSLTVSDGTRTVTVPGETPQRALRRETDEAGARKNLVKTGGTPFYVEKFSAAIDPGLMLPAAALNEMRRKALEELLGARSETVPVPARVVPPRSIPAHIAPERCALRARFSRASQIPEGEDYDMVILPAGEITPELLARWGEKLAAELPGVLFPEDEAAFAKKLAAMEEQGLRDIVADNIYGVRLGRRLGLRVHGGMGLNILNTRALDCYGRLGLADAALSFELAMSRAKAVGGTLPRGIVAYGYLPLMRWRNCPLRANVGCGKCRGEGVLTDRLGVKFPVECTERKSSTLLNSVPLHIAEKDLSGFAYLLLYFTRESREECGRVTEDYRLGRRAAGERTGGLYYRELL